MELTDNDRAGGYKPREIAQIAHVVFFTDYKLHCDENEKMTCGKERRISEKRALEVLGRELFLKGLCHSAFHWTATCENDGGEIVSFDSRKYFRD